MRRSLLIILVMFSFLLAACAGDDKSDQSDEQEDTSQFGPFEWDRDPNTIIVRVDIQPDQETPAFMMNSIPPCTVWGDSRVVWTVRDGVGNQQVFEARVSDETMRRFLEDIINRGFYTWEDEIVPSSSVDPQIETITVDLYDEVRTVRRFNTWPQNAYASILESCQQLSDEPTLVQPSGGWVSAWEIPRDYQAPSWYWPTDAVYTLADLTTQGQWIEGTLATEIWLSTRQERGDIQVIEGEKAYKVGIIIPGISRDSMAPPAQ